MDHQLRNLSNQTQIQKIAAPDKKSKWLLIKNLQLACYHYMWFVNQTISRSICLIPWGINFIILSFIPFKILTARIIPQD